MRLATLRDGTRDGQLVVVSHDLGRCTPAGTVAGTLQAALDNWAEAAPGLRGLAEELDLGMVEGEAFDEARCLSPLPRAYRWSVVTERDAGDPADLVRLRDAASDAFLAPREAAGLGELATPGAALEVGLAAIVDDVAQGISSAEAERHVVLLMLVSALGPWRWGVDEPPAAGAASLATTFAPVAVTPDELGAAWNDGRVALVPTVHLDESDVSSPGEPAASPSSFHDLIARAARLGRLGAGAIIGSGPLPAGGSGRDAHGAGEARPPLIAAGNRLRIEMHDSSGRSLFGAIEREIVFGPL